MFRRTSNYQLKIKWYLKNLLALLEPCLLYKNLDKELSFNNLFLKEKLQEDEPEKTNTESEVESMVTVPIHQDTSLVSLMTTLVIDLTVSQPVSTMVQAPLPTSTTTVTTITTTTSIPPPSPQP
ncbi:hypothetical protein Tco_0671813 [Tanacetum coccineum]